MSKALKSIMIWRYCIVIPSGKQWDQRWPWTHSWLSAGIDECFKSANESACYELKKSAGNDLTLNQLNKRWEQHFQQSVVARFSECWKNTVFIHERGNILVANDSQKQLLGQDMAIVASKWHINTNHDFICFIYVLTRTRNTDNKFLAYNRPFQLSTFPAIASRVCERDPSAPEGGCTPRKVGNCKDLYGGSQTNIWSFCALYSPSNCQFIRQVISGVVMYGKKSFYTRCQPHGCYFQIPFDIVS